MAGMFKAGNRMIRAEELPVLLDRYQLMAQLLRGLIIDDAIAEFPCTEEEAKAAISSFETQNQIDSPEAKQAWLAGQGIKPEQLEELILRPLQVEKFKQATWASKIESYFMSRKSYLDQAIYSLIRTRDPGLAQEIYYRILEGEQSFAELAKEYSQGPEANTGGLLGPVSLRQPHPLIGQLLSVSQVNQLWPPRALAEWYVIIRLEKFLPAQLDDAMRRRLIDEMFETWIAGQIKQMGSLELVNLQIEAEPAAIAAGE